MEQILIVDDNKTNLQYIKHVIGSRFDIIPVLSAKLALEYLSKHIPNMILLDILMPDMNGIELFKIIKKHDKWKEIPVIFLSADVDSQIEIECIRLGATDIIARPFVPEVFISRIEKHLELQYYRNKIKTLDQYDK